VLQDLLLFASAWSKAAFWRLVVSIHSPLELLCPRWWKWLLPGLCLTLAISAAPRARAQDTESVGDAARAFRAKHAAQANQDKTHPPQPPLSATTLVAWQVAGMPASDILNELQLRGIAFTLDDAHLNTLKDARLAPEFLIALPNVPSHPDASSASEVPRALITAAQTSSAKDYTAARHALESLVQKNRDANLYAALGNMNLLSGDLPSAETDFLQSEQLDPSFAYAHVRLAEIYYRSEQGPQMKEEAKKALRLQPNNAAARKYLALSITMESHDSGSFNSKNFNDLYDFKAGENTEANDLNNQGMALHEQGERTKAEAAYRHAIEMDPKVAVYYYNLGILYMNWPAGHDELATASSFAPIAPGQLLNQDTRKLQAIEAYKLAKALAPRNLKIRTNLGSTLCDISQYSEAVVEFRELLSMDPYWNRVRPCYVQALYGSGHVKESFQVEEDYKRYKNLDDSGDDGTALFDDDDKPRGVQM